MIRSKQDVNNIVIMKYDKLKTPQTFILKEHPNPWLVQLYGYV